jgi:gamma-glutamyltranspeptidase/glutathione hydrolase
MMRDFHNPGRSAVFATEGMAATSHPLATLAAVETLRAGGTAADAAVTAVAVLCVVEPAMTGIGGDCFCLVARPGQKVWGYNGSGRAPKSLRIEALLAQGLRSIGQDSIHSITVPGATEAWHAILAAHGRFGLDRALLPATRYAENGWAVAPRVGFDWALARGLLARDANAGRQYLSDGRAPEVGDVVRLPALAETLKGIANNPRALYEGPIAEEIAATVQQRGGFLSVEDLASHRGEAAEPISSNYRGLDVVELPPNGQGLTALVLLNILEQFDLGALDPTGAERFHLALEAARLAYGLRDSQVADPAHMQTKVPALLDKEFARKRARQIDPGRRTPLPQVPIPVGDTVYVTVVDRDRMAVSLINSLYHNFGSGIATERSGVLLHSRGAGFVLDPEHPNAIGPGKRPMHTIIPALGMRDGRCDLSFGVMGADYQPMGHAQVVVNMVDYGMDVQAAIDLPRLFFQGDMTEVENGIPAATLAGLQARGHTIVPRPTPLGGGQAIAIDWPRGVLIGGSDPRKDGCALGY